MSDGTASCSSMASRYFGCGPGGEGGWGEADLRSAGGMVGIVGGVGGAPVRKGGVVWGRSALRRLRELDGGLQGSVGKRPIT